MKHLHLGALFAIGLMVLVSAAHAAEETLGDAPLRIGVARLEGESGARMQSLLGGQLAERSGVEAVDVPHTAASPDPSAARAWAQAAGVSALVVGRVTDKPDRSSVMLELRSAHSGGAIARFQEQGSGEDALTSVSEKLAPLVLQAAGWQPPVAAAPPALAAISGPDSGRQAEAKDDGGKFGLGRANKDQPIKIRADELEVIETDEGRRFVFSLNVVVTQAEVMLQADRLEAFYPGEASQPDRLEARGHVRVRKGDRRASCDVAVYQRETQMLFCTGRAEMLHGCDLVRGDEIDFDLESERVKVRGAPSVLLRPRNEDPVTGETRCTAGAPDPGASS